MSYYHGTTISNGNTIVSTQTFIPSNNFCKYGKGVYFFSNTVDTETYIKYDIRQNSHLLEADIDTSTFYILTFEKFAEVFSETNTTSSMVDVKKSNGKLKYLGTDWDKHFLFKGNKGLIVSDDNQNKIECVVYDLSTISNIRLNKVVTV